MLAILEVSIVPLGTESPSISSYVAACHKLLENQDKVNYTLTPMGTILEGNLHDCLNLVQRMHEVPFKAKAQRVATQIKIDDRRDKPSSMKQKVTSVNSKLLD